MTRPAFKLRGIPVYMPTSGAIGFGLLSYVALPTAERLVGTGVSSMLLALVFGATIYLAILLHEIGHAFVALHYGYRVGEIVLTILGGHTLFVQEFKRPRHLALISLAGPVFNGITALLGYASLQFVSQPILESLIFWCTWSTFVMCVVNLLPGLPLDGGSVLQALVWAKTKDLTKAKRAAAIGGVVVAGIWAGSPYLLQAALGITVDSVDVAISTFVGIWLGMNAMAVLRSLKSGPEGVAATQIPEFQLNDVVRKAVAVESSETCLGAVAIATAAKAGAIIVTKDGVAVGIVKDEALAALDSTSKSNLQIASVARRLHAEDFLSVDMDYISIVDLLVKSSTQEWVVRDLTNGVVGVLKRSDIERKLGNVRS